MVSDSVAVAVFNPGSRLAGANQIVDGLLRHARLAE